MTFPQDSDTESSLSPGLTLAKLSTADSLQVRECALSFYFSLLFDRIKAKEKA